jgi:hypothetical protein
MCNVFCAILLLESLHGDEKSNCELAHPVLIHNVHSSVHRIVAQDAFPGFGTRRTA